MLTNILKNQLKYLPMDNLGNIIYNSDNDLLSAKIQVFKNRPHTSKILLKD